MSELVLLIVVAVIGYVIGSFPTAYIVGRLNGINIFQVGSGNMGMANTLRALGKGPGILVFVVDVVKGLVSVFIGWMLVTASQYQAWAGVIGGFAAVIGHNWSIFAALITGKLRGGKGAATTGGTWIALFAPWWYLVVGPLAVAMVVMFFTRYVSLAVLACATIGTIAILLLQSRLNIPPIYVGYVLVATILVYFRHRENIQRLMAGTERRLGDKA